MAMKDAWVTEITVLSDHSVGGLLGKSWTAHRVSAFSFQNPNHFHRLQAL